jgi:membrane protein
MALVRNTVKQFIDDDCQTMGAALAYYTTFSLTPILLVAIAVAGFFFGREAVAAKVHEQIAGMIGSGAAEQVSTMLNTASQDTSTGLLSGLFGVLAILFGATTAFAQLQAALNLAWQVKPDPQAGGFKSFLVKRLLTLGMVLSVGFLLLVSLVLSAAISGFNTWFAGFLPSSFSTVVLQAIHFVFSLIFIAFLFAAIFKFVPDAKIEWRDVWVGAAMTSLLFNVGKLLIGLYLGRSSAASAFGAAGSLIVIVLWVYYASQILLAGAEFTQVWAESRGKAIEPKKGAVRIGDEARQAEGSEPAHKYAA